MSHPVEMMAPMITSLQTPPTQRAHAIPAKPRLRRHRGAVAEWALAHGHVVRRDALAAIVGARAATTTADPVLAPWTADGVEHLLWLGVSEWCIAHGATYPDELPATLATYLRYLSAHKLLGPGSDNMTVLRRAIAENRTASGSSRRRHPAGASRAPVVPIS